MFKIITYSELFFNCMNASSSLIKEKFFVQQTHNPCCHSRHQLVGSVYLPPIEGVYVIVAFIMTVGRPYDSLACPVYKVYRKFHFRCPGRALVVLIFKTVADEHKVRVEEGKENI